MSKKHGRCLVMMPHMEEYRGRIRDHLAFKCDRGKGHTGMHQWTNHKGQRTDWEGGKR